MGKKRIKKQKITGWNLTCEDASHLGGPMGSEYTAYLFTKHFQNKEDAETYPEYYHKELGHYFNKEDCRWKKSETKKNTFYMDSLAFIWTLELIEFTEREEK